MRLTSKRRQHQPDSGDARHCRRPTSGHCAGQFPAGRPGIVERVAEALRAAGLIPAPEVNDSQRVVESALMRARLLLSSDEHLRGVDFARLTIELQKFDLTAPVKATPAEAVRKFFLH